MIKYITMQPFKIDSPFKLIQDQKNAVEKLYLGFKNQLDFQVLLGVTGSGKTFTIANLIEKIQCPTLIISHNKTLAAQLYQEFKSFFPQNAVSYFVSYYDFYQPEAYIPQTDTYIDKEAQINEEIDRLRLGATTNLLTRKDTIIVASVSCIYNLGSPSEYGNFVLEIKNGLRIKREQIIQRLVELQYQRSDYGFDRSTFRIRGNIIDIFPSYEELAYRIEYLDDKIISLEKINPMDGHLIEKAEYLSVYPAKHFMTDTNKNEAFAAIQSDLEKRVKELKDQGKLLECDRLIKKVNYDLEIIREVGYVNGIENYSRYFDGRNPGDPPYTLLEYFIHKYARDWLLVIDESHMSVPQIRSMYNGDRSRKSTLIAHGFRLPSAMDNRPLRFDEFMKKIPATIFVSATPDEWEMSLARESAAKIILSEHSESKDLAGRMQIQVNREIPHFVWDDIGVVEQLIRPTGIIDPKISVRPIKNQIQNLVKEIFARKKNGERVLVTTLTKKMAEDLTSFLNDKKFLHDDFLKHLKESDTPKVQYLHSDIETLVRSDILDDLRNGKYDVLIGINLLREGLDLPEVSLVAILDADKEGFLRSVTSLVQTMGRAARHVNGTVIMYADKITNSMKIAINEIERRRKIQRSYNKRFEITPISISKPIRDKLILNKDRELSDIEVLMEKTPTKYSKLLAIDTEQLTPYDKKKLIAKLEKEMKNAANILNFELAAIIRDKIKELLVN